MSQIAVIGTGYVGLTTAACMASLGHDVVGIDIVADKVERLSRAETSILEPGLQNLVRDGIRTGRLCFDTDATRVSEVEFVFLCVQTPQSEDGRADLTHIRSAAASVAEHLRPDAIVINKSTVPVGSTKVVELELRRPDVKVVSNPEFLREGHAVQDYFHPDRIVIGCADQAAAVRVATLYIDIAAPLIVMDPASAETLKYAANAFLATKISFINSIAAICESVGADIGDVILGLGYDKRIGQEFLKPGPGWGGSCLPKDTRALESMARDAGHDFRLLHEVIAVNAEQMDRVVRKITDACGGSAHGASIGIWGLTFKAGTDDLRESPSLAVIRRLVDAGAKVRAHDPTVDDGLTIDGVEIVGDALAAADGATAIVLLTEWDEYRWIDPVDVAARMSRPAVVDTRNLLDRAAYVRAGFAYQGIGRS